MKTGKKIKSVLNPDPEEKERSGGEASEKKSLKKKFYESKAYAGHVRRFIKRKKKQAERRDERQRNMASSANKRFQKSRRREADRAMNKSSRQKDREDTAKSVKNYFKASKQRKANRKAARSNRGDGGGFTCAGVECDA